MKTLKKVSFIVVAMLVYFASLPVAFLSATVKVIEKSVEKFALLLPEEVNDILDDFVK